MKIGPNGEVRPDNDLKSLHKAMKIATGQEAETYVAGAPVKEPKTSIFEGDGTLAEVKQS